MEQEEYGESSTHESNQEASLSDDSQGGGNSPTEIDHEPTKTLPSTRANIKSQFDLLRAWAVASGPSKGAISTPDVAKIAGRDPSTVSSCNNFFAEVGLLAKQGRSYLPADEVFDFNRAYEWEPDSAAHKLASVVRKSWAWEALGGRLGFKSMSEKEAIAVLADACEAGPKYKTQIASLIDFLVTCGLASKTESGMIAKGTSASESKSTHAKTDPQSSHTPEPKPKPEPATRQSGNALSMAINIDVSMEDVSKITDPKKVQDFFAKWAELVNAKNAIEAILKGKEVDHDGSQNSA